LGLTGKLPETNASAWWLETGSKSSVGTFLIHIDAQDAQDLKDSFQETASFSCRESAKPHRIIA